MKHGVTPASAGHSPESDRLKKGSPHTGKPFLIGDTALPAMFSGVFHGNRLYPLLVFTR